MTKGFVCFAAALVLAGCAAETVSDTRKAVTTRAAFQCELLQEPVALGGIQPQAGDAVSASQLSPFILLHMSKPGEQNRFGYASVAGSTVGVGERFEDDRWVIKNWDRRPPFLTLVTKFDNQNILVSVRTGERSHVTFAGKCKDKTQELGQD